MNFSVIVSVFDKSQFLGIMSSGKDDSSSPFSSLSYQILLVFGWFYFIIYVIAECLLVIFKRVYFLYPLNNFFSELALLLMLTGIESVRIFIGKKGNLTERPLPIVLSLLLTVPVSCAVTYFLYYQTYVLMIDVVLSIILFVFVGMQTLFAIFTLVSFGR